VFALLLVVLTPPAGAERPGGPADTEPPIVLISSVPGPGEIDDPTLADTGVTPAVALGGAAVVFILGTAILVGNGWKRNRVEITDRGESGTQ
jgi:hypothetical protein